MMRSHNLTKLWPNNAQRYQGSFYGISRIKKATIPGNEDGVIFPEFDLVLTEDVDIERSWLKEEGLVKIKKVRKV